MAQTWHNREETNMREPTFHAAKADYERSDTASEKSLMAKLTRASIVGLIAFIGGPHRVDLFACGAWSATLDASAALESANAHLPLGHHGDEGKSPRCANRRFCS